tara:strand:- start:1484 stop:1801 length:318 start_codon:yes stop_codon:yes gene_type:complete
MKNIDYDLGNTHPTLSDEDHELLMKNMNGFTTYLPTGAGLSRFRISEVIAVSIINREEHSDPYKVDVHLSTGTIFTVRFYDPSDAIQWAEWLVSETMIEIQRSIK